MNKFILISIVIQFLSYSHMSFSHKMPEHKNVLNGKLEICSTDPLTGWFRSGKCESDSADQGTHTVCAVMNDDFLKFTKSKGNDLSTPSKKYSFPGLKSGDQWCLCALRYLQALDDGHAPKVILKSTNQATIPIFEYFGKSIKDLQ